MKKNFYLTPVSMLVTTEQEDSFLASVNLALDPFDVNDVYDEDF